VAGETTRFLLGLLVGTVGSLIILQLRSRWRAHEARGHAIAILAEARREAELRSKEDDLRRREAFEGEVEEARKDLREHEKRLENRSDALDRKLDVIQEKERVQDALHQELAAQRDELARRHAEAQQVLADQRQMLHHITGLRSDEARTLLLRRTEEELHQELGGLILRHEQTLRETCHQRTREILISTIQRYAASHTAEVTVSTVDIPNDDMKGRIIGREGRNIRAFEKATGVDVIVDDTPGVVIITGFDSVRREIAKIALERLIQDGRIHPTRIEEMVRDTQQEMDGHIRELGRAAAQEANVADLHEKLHDLLGRLKFRTSYSQNVLQHSLEVAYLTGLMAEEVGLDGALGRRCGLLHDIGKAADHEMEGGHPAIGAELARRYGERHEVVHAAFGHHDDLRPDSPYTLLVAAADTISASRPGARRETLEKYVRRLEELEALACGFPGVEQAYALQAGREIRVIADSQQLTDADAAKLCRDIAKAVQEQLIYPGEVKVTVLRETRNVEFAR
jgi:ribonuclease Y